MMRDTLYNKVKKANLDLHQVAEIGVGDVWQSNIYGFMTDGIKSILVEPHPTYAKSIRAAFQTNPNIRLFEVAISTFNGETVLYLEKDSSFIQNTISSPAIANHYFNPETAQSIKVKTQIFSEIDDGEIDLISIDTEGSEWFVLQTMISRPKIISVETHNRRYINPSLEQIKTWMQDNQYEIWYKTESDSIYVKRGLIPIGYFNKLLNYCTDLKLGYIYSKKKFNDQYFYPLLRKLGLKGKAK